MPSIHNPGVPSPEGNPIARQLWPLNVGPRPTPLSLPQRPISFPTLGGNRIAVPVAPFGRIRLAIEIDQAGILDLNLADTLQRSVDSSKVAATATLTLTANLSNGDTVTINGKVYTAQTTLTDSDGNFLMGASASDTIDNLIAAINLGSGAGTLYATSTTPNTDVSAAAGAGDTMDVTALYGGTVGNAITTAETSLNASWSGPATLGGGVDGDLAADGTSIPADTLTIVEITGYEAASPEHVGEPWLVVAVGSLAAAANVRQFMLSGSSW